MTVNGYNIEYDTKLVKTGNGNGIIEMCSFKVFIPELRIGCSGRDSARMHNNKQFIIETAKRMIEKQPYLKD